MNRRTFARLIGGAASVTVLTGCTVLDALDEDRVSIEITAISTFEPGGIEIAVGETVVWRNKDSRVHTVSIDPAAFGDAGIVAHPEGATPFTSNDILPNERFTHTFDVPGDYIYGCTIHQDQRMIATIRVKE